MHFILLMLLTGAGLGFSKPRCLELLCLLYGHHASVVQAISNT